MPARKLQGLLFNFIALISLLISMTSCTPFAGLSSVETFLTEYDKQPAQYLYLASQKIATTRDVEVQAEGCLGFSHVVISESASAPTVDSIAWQPCLNAGTVYTYQISTTSVGEKTIYFHTRLNNTIGSVKKTVKVVYAPKAVIGESTMNDITSYQRSLYTPHGMHSTGTDLWINDFQNNRILKYNTVPTSNSATANLILGQPSYKTVTQNYGGASASSFGHPIDSHSDGTRLVVADYDNSRVMIWNTMPTNNYTPADVVLGQTNFSNHAPNPNNVDASSLFRPRGVHISGGKLFVADGSNHRVLIWNTIPTTNAQPADVVLGQTTMASATASSALMNTPSAVTTAGTKLFVTDYGNHRVLVWNTIPTTNFQTADFALGQTAVASNTANVGGSAAANTLDNPYRIAVSGTKLAVTDYGNHRVLIWNTIPTTMQQPADVVLGQADFSGLGLNTGGMSAYNLNAPRGLTFAGNKLAVSDGNNNRVLIWNTVPTVNNTPADVVLGQADFTSTNNHHTARTGPTSIQGINMFTDGQRIVATDILMNRVLIWNSIPTTNNQPADLVLGQSNFSSALPNRGSPTSPTASTLNAPLQSVIIGNKLVVNDQLNQRLLIWNTMPTTNGQAADLVLGQASFTTMTSGLTPSKLNLARKIFTDGTKLFVPEEANHRVLVWNTVPTVSNTAANYVLGQSDFYTNTANFGGMSASSIYKPDAGFVYNNKLFLADANNRLLVWNTTPTTNNQASDFVLGQPNFSSSGTLTQNNEMQKVGQLRSVFAYDNKLYATGTYQGHVKIWNSIPTSTFQAADMTYGFSYLRYQPAVAAAVDEFSLQESVTDIYTDNYRFIISDRNRIVITPYPNVLLSQSPEGRGGTLDLAARSCDGISKILFNEGSVPASGDSGWQTCSTAMDSLHYTISGGSEGRRDIKVWYKDTDGHVLPEQQGLVPYIYDLTNQSQPSMKLSTATTTNLLTGELTNYTGCFSFTEVYASGSPTPPTQSSPWSTCSTATGGLSYSIPEPAADGPNNIYIWSRDSSGNIIATPTVVVVTLDRTPPASTPAMTLVRKGLATISGFRFTAADCTDVAGLLITESDTLPSGSAAGWQTCSTTAGAITYAATQETNTTHGFRIWAKDVYGNVNATPRFISYTPAGVPTILGQIDAATNFNAQAGLFSTASVFSDGTRLVVTDTYNNRVLIWNTIPLVTHAVADVVVGQNSLFGTAANMGSLTPSASSLNGPLDAKIFGTRLVVADYTNNRVLVWNTIPTTNGQPADLVLGQPNFTSKIPDNGGTNASAIDGAASVAYNGTQFFVADRDNNRILMWNSFPTSNQQAANLVIGQPNFTSVSANKGGLDAFSLSGPYDVSTISTDKVVVADTSNNRILIWNSIPTVNYSSADFVLGQPSLKANTANNGGVTAGSLYAPRRTLTDGSNFYVTDSGNNRVLIWNAIPTTTGQTANVVVGQTGMTGNSDAANANRMNNPQAVAVQGTKLFVADRDNNRVSVWNTVPVSNGISANYTLGQTSTGGSTFNMRPTASVNGNFWKTSVHFYATNTHSLVTDQANSRVLIWNSDTISGTAQVVLGQPDMFTSTAGVTSTTLNNPRAAIIIGTKLAVTDYDNNRVLIWNTIPTTNAQPADVVLGQVSFTTLTTNHGGISSASLSNPYELASNGTNLIVADKGNNRVLIWNTIPTVNKTPADIVLGQPDFSSFAINNGGRTGATLNTPIGVSTNGNYLVVGDYDNHRVLIWNSLSTVTSGQAADVIVGQANPTTATAGSTIDRHRNAFTGLINGGKLYVSDRNNNRVLVYDTIPTSDGAAASHIIGQTDAGTTTSNQNGMSGWSLYGPSGLHFHKGLLHIFDAYNDRIIAINPGL